MDKNLVLAISLSVLVYALWFGWIEKHAAPPPAAAAAASTIPPASAGLPAAAPPAALPEATALLETPGSKITLSTLGSGISHFQYRGPTGLDELILQPENPLFATPGLPLKLASSDSSEAVFKGRLPGGASLAKIFRFNPNGGWSELDLELSNPGRAPLAIEPVTLTLGPGLGTAPSDQGDLTKQWRVLAHPPGLARIQKLKPGTAPGAWDWAGIDNRYFLAAVFHSSADIQAEARQEKIGSAQAPLLVLTTPSLTLSAGQTARLKIPFYLGPKQYDHLKTLGYHLEESVDFGFFGSIGKIIFVVLKAIQRRTGNYGWSILILTLALQALLLPLSLKAFKATAAMKKLQPQIQRVQEKYKDEPQRLNIEMMQLYKSSGTNPLGGCLPMLAQIPIFWALYTALRNAWELNGAPWIFWIRDLSAQDPYYVLPIIMGGAMFLQQKLSPPTPDPTQAKMMQFMPVIFTFMFFKFPAGLVLYWMTNNFVSVLTQLILRKHLEGA